MIDDLNNLEFTKIVIAIQITGVSKIIATWFPASISRRDMKPKALVSLTKLIYIFFIEIKLLY